MEGSDAAGALVALMERLRNECPWDRKQTARDLAGYLLEECYEVLEALSREDWQELEGELGRSPLPDRLSREARRGARRLRLRERRAAHPRQDGRAPPARLRRGRGAGRRRRPRAMGGAQAQGAREGGPPSLAVRRRPARASGAPEGRAPDLARRGPRLRLGARRGRPRQAGRGGRRVQGRAARRRAASGRSAWPPRSATSSSPS